MQIDLNLFPLVLFFVIVLITVVVWNKGSRDLAKARREHAEWEARFEESRQRIMEAARDRYRVPYGRM